MANGVSGKKGAQNPNWQQCDAGKMHQQGSLQSSLGPLNYNHVYCDQVHLDFSEISPRMLASDT